MKPHVASRPRPLALIFLLAAVVAAGGCGRKIVAKVNGEPIHRDEFVDWTINFRNVNPSEGSGAGLQALSAMVLDAIVMQEAKRENVVPTDAEVNQRMQMIAQQLGQRGVTLEQFLQRSGITMEAARTEMRSDLARRNLLTKGLQINDQEVQKFYDEHKRDFTTPEQVKIHQLTVNTEREAKEARSDLKNADFGLVALSRSVDVFKQVGGAVPPFSRGQPGLPVDPHVQQIAFTMKAGQISDPIKVSGRWVIIKVDEIIPAKTPTLAEMKELIREGLLQQKAQQTGRMDQMQQRLMTLRQNAEIEILDDQFKNAPQFQKRPAATPSTLPGGAVPPGAEAPGATPPPAPTPEPNAAPPATGAPTGGTTPAPRAK
jgi:foldase protein PrsA